MLPVRTGGADPGAAGSGRPEADADADLRSVAGRAGALRRPWPGRRPLSLIVGGERPGAGRESRSGPVSGSGPGVRPGATALPQGASRTPQFQPLVLGVRWAGLAAGLAVAAPIHGNLVRPVVVWGIVLVIYTAVRTARPLPIQDRAAASPALSYLPFLLDVGLTVAAVVSTGYWKSPFAFCLFAGVIAAGFSRGYAFATRLAVGASLAVTLPYLLTATSPIGQGLRQTVQWAVELLLIAVLAGYSKRMFGEAERRHSQTMDRMAYLSEANELLVSLHRVAQQLPASLNLESALMSTVAKLRSMIRSDITAVLLHDDVNAQWTVAAGDGTRIGRVFKDGELPSALAGATASSVASLVVCVDPGSGLGPELLSHTAMYAPLRARGSLVGMVALEHHAPGSYGRRELQLLDSLIEPAALAIDNARWFAKLRAIGADEERVRIARDMHDRLGQSLASVAFGLDRIRKRVDDESLVTEIDELRNEVREALGEVRETLGDLRSVVTADRGIVETLTRFLERIEDRTGLEVNFEHEGDGRLPFVQEQELWWIAQEAIINVERHAQATHLSVRWRYDGHAALVVVADDGKGFLRGRAGRADSYGMRGMQERADAIGASLEIDSAPGSGTVVRCRLNRMVDR